MLYLVLLVLPILYLASMATVTRWNLSTARSVFAVVVSLVAAVVGLVLGYQYWIDKDTSGDASALTAGLFFAAFVAGPVAGLMVFWATIAFSKLFAASR